MVVTIPSAIEVALAGISIITKAVAVLQKGEHQSIAEELQRLEAARLRTSASIIEEADRDSQKEVKE